MDFVIFFWLLSVLLRLMCSVVLSMSVDMLQMLWRMMVVLSLLVCQVMIVKDLNSVRQEVRMYGLSELWKREKRIVGMMMLIIVLRCVFCVYLLMMWNMNLWKLYFLFVVVSGVSSMLIMKQVMRLNVDQGIWLMGVRRKLIVMMMSSNGLKVSSVCLSMLYWKCLVIECSDWKGMLQSRCCNSMQQGMSVVSDSVFVVC